MSKPAVAVTKSGLSFKERKELEQLPGQIEAQEAEMDRLQRCWRILRSTVAPRGGCSSHHRTPGQRGFTPGLHAALESLLSRE